MEVANFLVCKGEGYFGRNAITSSSLRATRLWLKRVDCFVKKLFIARQNWSYFWTSDVISAACSLTEISTSARAGPHTSCLTLFTGNLIHSRHKNYHLQSSWCHTAVFFINKMATTNNHRHHFTSISSKKDFHFFLKRCVLLDLALFLFSNHDWHL